MAANHFNIVGGPMGNQQISSGQLPDTTQRQASGMMVNAVSPYWGGAEFIYARFGGTVRMFGLCIDIPDISSGAIRHNMTECPSTTIMGKPVYVAMTSGTVGQFGWFMQSGVVPINSNAAVAADVTFSVAATGQGGAAAAGKQIVGARIVIASDTTVAKTNTVSAAGSYIMMVTNSDGWFIGAYLSGTGVGSGAKITDISPDGKTVTVDVVSTAAISGTVTATYNNSTIYYNVAHINRPFAQGAIT